MKTDKESIRQNMRMFTLGFLFTFPLGILILEQFWGVHFNPYTITVIMFVAGIIHIHYSYLLYDEDKEEK